MKRKMFIDGLGEIELTCTEEFVQDQHALEAALAFPVTDIDEEQVKEWVRVYATFLDEPFKQITRPRTGPFEEGEVEGWQAAYKWLNSLDLIEISKRVNFEREWEGWETFGPYSYWGQDFSWEENLDPACKFCHGDPCRCDSASFREWRRNNGV